MSEEPQKSGSMVPHLLLAGAVIIVLVAVYFVFLAPDEEPQQVTRQPAPPPVVAKPEPEPVVEETLPEPEPEEPVEVELPPPEPVIDTSDGAVKTAILGLTDYEMAASLLVNDALLERFVVLTANLSRGEQAPNYQLLVPPSQKFRVYQQASKEWIDAASYKRYTPYVDVLDGLDTDQLIELYYTYKPAISDKYAEIGDPDDDFDGILQDAIEHLLETPEVPMPVEVYTDSVMYKFSDERLEALSPVQKHLLRMGPENMRRVKAKLREISAALP